MISKILLPISAFVIHRRPYRDTSLLLELFTQTDGRITAIAKGAKRARSALRNTVHLFQPLLIRWQGRHDIVTLTQAECEYAFDPLPASYLAWGFYLNELLYRLLNKHDPYPNLFNHYHHIIYHLSHKQADERLLRLFERDLLHELGYGLQLKHEANSQKPIEASAYYHFLPMQGAIKISIADNRSYAYSGKSLLALAQGEWSDKDSLHDAKRLLRTALAVLLGDKPLKSRELC